MKTEELKALEEEILNHTAKSSKRRRLSAKELSSAEKIYGETIDYDLVDIVPHSNFLFKNRPFVIYNRIYLPEEWYMDDLWDYNGHPDLVWYFRTIIIHELCHVWQHQTPDLNYHWFKAFMEGIIYGKDVYKYNITEHSCLSDFRFEQQGQILQDYSHWLLRYGERPQAHRNVINCRIPQPSDHVVEKPMNSALPVDFEAKLSP